MKDFSFKMLEGERWWGGIAFQAVKMPFNASSDVTVDLYFRKDLGGFDTTAPFFVSTCGRYLWSEDPYVVTFKDGEVRVSEARSEVTLGEGYGTMREAYKAACQKHFPFCGEIPDERFFSLPQYNTWIELNFFQTQEAVLKYAHDLIDNGFPAGVLMIDGGWQIDYGLYEFNRMRFPDPKAMTDELHAMGFKVMVWVSPIIASAGKNFKTLRAKKYLVRDNTGDTAIRKWWSGHSAVLDLSNPDAMAWIDGYFKDLMENYGVDGFKFDAGGPEFYRDDDITFAAENRHDQMRYFVEWGAKYKFNEYRCEWKAAGLPLVSRLQDKVHSWTDRGINMILPCSLAQGLLGSAYCCPDMIGGGDEVCFVDKDFKGDRELIVRWAQASALLPMMQFSLAPWRVMDGEMLDAVKRTAYLHKEYGPMILDLARHAAKTGEPIARAMEYCFPGCGFESVVDQFMLGDEVLVAPVLTKETYEREIRFPAGKWKGDDGSIVEGPCTQTVDVPLTRLPYYKKIG